MLGLLPTRGFLVGSKAVGNILPMMRSVAGTRTHGTFFKALLMTCASANVAASEGKKPSFLDGAKLFDQNGNAVSPSVLEGTTVALYISGEWCPMCTSFTPDLKAFYGKHKTCSKSGQQQLSIIFVSSDANRLAAEDHFSRQGDWLYLDYGSPLRQELKRRYKIWSGREVPELGASRRSGIPGLVVVGRDGAQRRILDTEARGRAALDDFDVPAHRWE